MRMQIKNTPLKLLDMFSSKEIYCILRRVLFSQNAVHFIIASFSVPIMFFLVQFAKPQISITSLNFFVP